MSNAELKSPWFANARALAAADALVRAGLSQRRATMEISVRSLPDHWGFVVCCGVDRIVRLVERIAPGPREILLAEKNGCIGGELARLLATTPCCVDIDVAPEGTPLFVGDPIATVEGPLWQAWIVAEMVRDALLTSMAAATRTARLVLASKDTAIIDGSSCTEQDFDRQVVIAQAAYVGGAAFTQSLAAAAKLGIPVRAAPSADALALIESPELGLATGGTLPPNAQDTHSFLGSGEDEEETLAEMHRKSVCAEGWIARGLNHRPSKLCCGINLVALEQNGIWIPRLGAELDLSVVPGRKLVIRYVDSSNRPIADIMHGTGERIQPAKEALIVGCPQTSVACRVMGAEMATPLHISAIRSGSRVGPHEGLAAARERARASLIGLHECYTRLRHPLVFPVGMAPSVAQLKIDLLAALR